VKTVGTNEGTTSDLHPEEMLSAARQGTLDPRMRRDLMVHLTQCAACRMELELASDIVVEGELNRHDGALLSDMVRRSLADAPGGAGYREGRSGFGRSSMATRRLMIPAVCLLLGGGVATGMWSVRHESGRGPTIEELPTRHARARATPRSPAHTWRR